MPAGGPYQFISVATWTHSVVGEPSGWFTSPPESALPIGARASRPPLGGDVDRRLASTADAPRGNGPRIGTRDDVIRQAWLAFVQSPRSRGPASTWLEAPGPWRPPLLWVADLQTWGVLENEPAVAHHKFKQRGRERPLMGGVKPEAIRSHGHVLRVRTFILMSRAPGFSTRPASCPRRSKSPRGKCSSRWKAVNAGTAVGLFGQPE